MRFAGLLLFFSPLNLNSRNLRHNYFSHQEIKVSNEDGVHWDRHFNNASFQKESSIFWTSLQLEYSLRTTCWLQIWMFFTSLFHITVSKRRNGIPSNKYNSYGCLCEQGIVGEYCEKVNSYFSFALALFSVRRTLMDNLFYKPIKFPFFSKLEVVQEITIRLQVSFFPDLCIYREIWSHPLVLISFWPSAGEKV